MVLNNETEIEMLMFDQERIVSYKELVNKLNIDPSEARKSIQKFITSKRESKNKDKNSEFYVTYLVTGEYIESKNKKIFLANEEDLNNLEGIKILYKQVYSIQKNHIKDFDLIYASDIDASSNIERKSNLNIIEKCSEDDEMIIAMMDDRENQNPNQHKKTQMIQAEEIKKLVINKPTNESSKATSVASNDTKTVTKPPTNIDTNKIIKTSSEKAHVKDEPTENNSDIAAKKAKPNSEENKKIEDSSKPTGPSVPVKKAEASKNPPKNQSTLTSFFKKK